MEVIFAIRKGAHHFTKEGLEHIPVPLAFHFFFPNHSSLLSHAPVLFTCLVPKPLAEFLLRLFVSRAVQMRWDRRLAADQVDEDCSGEGCPKSTLVSPQELSQPPSPFVAIFLRKRIKLLIRPFKIFLMEMMLSNRNSIVSK